MKASRSLRNDIIDCLLKNVSKNCELENDGKEEINSEDSEYPLLSLETHHAARASIPYSVEAETRDADTANNDTDSQELFSECEDTMPNSMQVESIVLRLEEHSNYYDTSRLIGDATMSQHSNSNICGVHLTNDINTDGSSKHHSVQFSDDINGILMQENEASEDEHRCAKKKRSYNKLLACYFCHKLLKLKMKRHLETVHAKEPEVAELLNTASLSERALGFSRFINRGILFITSRFLKKEKELLKFSELLSSFNTCECIVTTHIVVANIKPILSNSPAQCNIIMRLQISLCSVRFQICHPQN
jgi:hypothetical protein